MQVLVLEEQLAVLPFLPLEVQEAPWFRQLQDHQAVLALVEALGLAAPVKGARLGMNLL